MHSSSLLAVSEEINLQNFELIKAERNSYTEEQKIPKSNQRRRKNLDARRDAVVKNVWCKRNRGTTKSAALGPKVSVYQANWKTIQKKPTHP